MTDEPSEPDTRTLSIDDVQAIADAVTLQMLSLPRELSTFLTPQRSIWLNLSQIEANPPLGNVSLKITTDHDGLWIEFSAQGNLRLALLRFNYRGWAWHRFDVPRCPLCQQDHRVRTNRKP